VAARDKQWAEKIFEQPTSPKATKAGEAREDREEDKSMLRRFNPAEAHTRQPKASLNWRIRIYHPPSTARDTETPRNQRECGVYFVHVVTRAQNKRHGFLEEFVEKEENEVGGSIRPPCPASSCLP